MNTGKRETLINIKLTGVARPTLGTGTHKRTLRVQTCPSVLALVWRVAFVDVRLAVNPCPACST